MKRVDERYKLLKESGFRKDGKTGTYFNPQVKKLFGRESVADHALAWLRSALEESNDTGTVPFYFNQPVQEETRQSWIARFRS